MSGNRSVSMRYMQLRYVPKEVYGNIKTSGYVDVNGPRIMSGTASPSGSVSAPKGSLYIKTNATTSTTRLWINTDSGTTWAYFTASA
jgi:hypothetical protein